MYIQFVYNSNITFYTFTDKFTEQICTTTYIMEFGNDRTNSITTLELISIFVHSEEVYFVYKIDKSLYYLLDGYQRGLLFRDLQRILFKDKHLSFVYFFLS